MLSPVSMVEEEGLLLLFLNLLVIIVPIFLYKYIN